MIRLNYPLFLLFILFISSSCTTVSYFETTVHQLPEKMFPAVGQSLILVNNSVEQPLEKGSFVHLANGNQYRFTFERDTLTYKIIDFMGMHLQESGQLSDVVIYNLPQRHDTLYNRVQSLTPGQLNQIQQESDASWIFSLDRLTHFTTLKEASVKDFNVTTAHFHTIIAPVFQLYKSGETIPFALYSLTDTIEWQATDLDFKKAIKRLPDLNACMQDAMYITAQKAVNAWLPSIREESRLYVNHPHSAMREARVLLINGKGQDACYMWEYVFETVKNNNIRQYAAFNRAIYAESVQDFEAAVFWITKAIEMNPEKAFIGSLSLTEYQQVLRSRQETYIQHSTF